MHKRLLFLCTTLLLPLTLYSSEAVTYPKDGGRFGDRLIDYIHAKWISLRDDVPFLYHPFHYSKFLVLSREETHIAEAAPFLDPSQVFVCPYFPEAKHELQSSEWEDRCFNIDFENEEFLQVLRKMIAPIEPLNCIHPPKDCISIALHIREGGGYDPSNISLSIPYKIPPPCFYPTCLNRVLEILAKQPVFCFVFTDAKDPSLLVQQLQKSIPQDYPISFHYRESGNSCSNNVLEDFFSFQNFDILIRPDSNFSIVPSLLHRFAIVCSPLEFWFDESGQPHTQEIEVVINEPI